MDAIPLQLFGLLKLIRVRRLSKIILQLNLKEDTKMVRALIYCNSAVPKASKIGLLPDHVFTLLGMHLVPNSGTRQDLDTSTRLCDHRDRRVRII